MVDWIDAFQIAGFGFLTVFVVLSILALVLWIVSIFIYRIINKPKAEEPEQNAEKV